MAEIHGIPHDTATESERRGASSVPSPPGLWMSWSEAPGGAPELICLHVKKTGDLTETYGYGWISCDLTDLISKHGDMEVSWGE